jgi:Matrixin
MERTAKTVGAGLRRVALRGALTLVAGASIAVATAPAASASKFVEHPHVKRVHRHVKPVLMASIAEANGIATSPAQQFAVGGVAMTVARQIANGYWGYDPCGGQVAISWASLDPSINATSTWWNPTDAYADPQQNNNCQVQFNTNQAFDWQMFCTVFVHEFGHLTGHPHVNDQNNVMYPIYVQPIQQCAQAPDPTAQVAVPAAASPKTTPVVTKAAVRHKVRSHRTRHAHGAAHRKHHHKKHAKKH